MLCLFDHYKCSFWSGYFLHYQNSEVLIYCRSFLLCILFDHCSVVTALVRHSNQISIDPSPKCGAEVDINLNFRSPSL